MKNFFEDIVQIFKNKFFSSKYVVKGKCKQCGKCCCEILLSDENGYFKDEESFFRYQKKKGIYKSFTINGRMETEDAPGAKGALLFKCKFLTEKGTCKIYFFRPIFCRNYPEVNTEFIHRGGETLDGCGFYFGVDKKFEEYLK